MNNYDIFEKMRNRSSMYLASNKKLQCSIDCGIDIRDIRLFEVKNQTYDTIAKNLYAIENVLDAMQFQNITYVYLIRGTGTKIHYYYGVAPVLNDEKRMSDILNEVKRGEEILVANFEANFVGSQMIELTSKEREVLHRELRTKQFCTVLEGVPGIINPHSTTLGIDCFASTMERETFLVMVLAQPLAESEVNEIVLNQQAVLDSLVPLIDYSKINQKSSISEVAGFSDRNNVNTTSHTNTSAEQLQFQLYAASSSVPLKMERGSLQQLEDLFFINGVANDDLMELMNALFLEQQRKTRQNGQKEKVEVEMQSLQNSRGCKGGGTDRGRNAFAMPVFRRNNANTRGNNRNRNNAVPCKKSEYKITENNVDLVGDTIRKHLPNIEANVVPKDEMQLRVQEAKKENEESGFDEVEDLTVDLFRGQNEFTLASINRQDSRANVRANSCSTNSKIAANKREACTNICSVTERYTNQAVSSWNRYLVDIVNARLVYGENRGIYVCSTTVFANSQSELAKTVAAWKGMNEYDIVSKVPITETMLHRNTNQYNNIVNFRIPKYFYSDRNRVLQIPYEETLARSAYSQITAGNYIYGGNWISSKELRYITALPLRRAGTLFVSDEDKNRNNG
ncbi:hypothetical protein [Anaerosporobacter sp.]|uniref:hypothetical protein n=1 Tax=Anaerosporobacter sp. TaxID=1872529 RepID=UPI00286F01A5|nr:hypothetical protein [Anaerosporobacter sp.]